MGTRILVLLLATLLAALALQARPAAAARTFPETGFSITNDKILDYFDRRGGARVFGPPISRGFTFMGTRVQFFQRAVMQIQPNGNVGLINLLTQDFLPYTRVNGSTFPAMDSALATSAPSAADPFFGPKALDFIRAFAPDEWEGMRTNFYTTFMTTVTFQDAFPTGGEPGLLPLINLEVWGLPISKPTYDPNNGNFVYLRFQRGIMHFDKATGATQGILLGDYLKSVLTGWNLPPDLDQQARPGKLYRQYDNGSATGVARPGDLQATNMFAAFEKDGVVVPTPMPATAVPTPMPATPIPTPVPAPAAPAAPTPVPAPPAPASIALVGDARFVEQVNAALNLLATKSPYNHGIVRQYVYRIEQGSWPPSADYATRTLRIDESTAWPNEWNSYPDNQQEWLASLIVHNAVHIGQAVRGVSTTDTAAESEALVRQQDALAAIETTRPTGQFWKYIQEGIDKPTGWFGHWQQLRSPVPNP